MNNVPSFPRAQDLGLYIHIPFCPSKCHYCSFAVLTDQSSYSAYLSALKKELRDTMNSLHTQGRTVGTIYFGGGTPSTLRLEDIKEILDIAVNNSTPIQEISFEMNPEHVTREYVDALKKLGITRISMGVQTLNPELLRKTGRRHTPQEALHALQVLSEAHMNFNVDLILGLPGETEESFLHSLQTVLSFKPKHISLYFLTIEPGTVFQKLPRGALPTEEHTLKLYTQASSILAAEGFVHYEISNWAKPGFESSHNLMYWRGKEYLGVGLGASSFFEGKRWSNFQNMNLYLEAEDKKNPASLEVLSKEDLVESYLMTALRLQEGVHMELVKKSATKEFVETLEQRLQKACTLGYLLPTKEGYTIPETERLFHNHIVSFLLT